MKETIRLAHHCLFSFAHAQPKGDDFSDVVKLVERFYHVKHKGIPFLARAGMKTATTVARLAGGQKASTGRSGQRQSRLFRGSGFHCQRKLRAVQVDHEAALTTSWSPLDPGGLAQRRRTDARLSARGRRQVQRPGHDDRAAGSVRSPGNSLSPNVGAADAQPGRHGQNNYRRCHH